MSRPRRPGTLVKLNLLVEQKSKRRAFALAVKTGLSVGRLFEKLLARENERVEQSNGAERKELANV
jgi:hypothetical protein